MSRNDDVALVAGRLKLSPPLSVKILESTRSELRGLKFQNPNGTFGKGDNDLKRASALLEYVARELEGIKIPLDKLAKAAYVRERDFRKFHQQVGNFRPKPESSQQADPSTTTRNSIPSLAMKLGSYLTDSNGVAIRAQRLLNQITRFSQNNPHQLRDIFRFAKAYEAVCFYIVATQDASPGGTSTGRKDDEGEEGKQLQVATIVDVSTDFTLSEFANILEHVQSIIGNMKERASSDNAANKQIEKAAPSKKRKAGGNRSSALDDSSSSLGEGNSSSTTRGNHSTKKDRTAAQAQDVLEQVKERADFMETLNDDPFDEVPFQEDRTSCYSAKFLEWKRQVIAQATKSVTAIPESDANGDDDSDQAAAAATRAKALECAARNVLVSLGLLQARS
jgi:hypothetical protein